MILHFILSMCLEVSQISLWGHFISVYLLCVGGDCSPWSDRIHHRHLSLLTVPKHSAAFLFFWDPLNMYVSLMKWKTWIIVFWVLLSAVSMAASIKQDSAFPVINICLRCSSAVTSVLDDHMAVLGCQFPSGSVTEYFNWKRGMRALGSAWRYPAWLWNANLVKTRLTKHAPFGLHNFEI